MHRTRVGFVPVLSFMAVYCFSAVQALAADGGQPQPWQMGYQKAATPVMEHITSLHDFITWIMAGVVVLVLGLLGYVAVRFNANRNPVPATFSHNVTVEVLWTLVPVLVLISIAVPSFRLLYMMDKAQDAEMTLKVTGHQWYWSYEYPDHGGLSFDSFMKDAASLQSGDPRLLAVDREAVVPVGTTIRVLLTSEDVLHSWAVPSLGVKTDTMPGRLNETWIRIEKPGTYYGQCSELCGVQHGFMPIAVRAVAKKDFDRWVAAETAASGHGGENVVALNEH
ncbi:cytochrome c oxidase subunit II [Haematospirillum jordaniae]|uniref:Cytochrome c oxidase subunit 2 n=1 Tax=Haematospirillum jordaniae TaxID=1549855 RepID=A0A143DE63_9PROT|nr:cytochrome c oxidase subunit II [Haematospirillum jordaniae]AMW35014.1 cytochrome C oxidase subunit II [Haematospirillum jordaniae]NKD56629.1 cytochrome c oxidase subunit II [Haematospirillum jordaniae]NKD58687.1 cytochrome c oxidase subunit II [Haematospirillum jordaniae]NKD66144.1 cytochrome c oxidase subunit II [Haematospirillum jordaniae]NKD78689.1 cytochrome c oxidase subunit II [Haematospirillum jordaniae]